MNQLTRVGLLVALFSIAATAVAHRASDSYLRLDFDSEPPVGRWDIALRDLEFALGLDMDLDGAITWGEVRGQHLEIADFALGHLKVWRDGSRCMAVPGHQQIAQRESAAFNVLPIEFHCDSDRGPVRIDYHLLFDLDPTHRGLAAITKGGQQFAAVFSPESASFEARAKNASPWATFVRYCHEGLRHILAGPDHLLFLLVLLLPSVLVHEHGSGSAIPALWPVVRNVARIVTAFTLAHSLTLTPAALGWVMLPAQLIEPAIAATILLAALNNIFPIFPGGGTGLAFALGLVHGFGFAGALLDLGLTATARTVSLAGFNLGVECGQILVVCAALPLVHAMRHREVHRLVVLRGGSLGAAAIATSWLLDRTI